MKRYNEIRELIKSIVDEYYPSKANREVISLYDLITIGILAHLHFNGVIKQLTFTSSKISNFQNSIQQAD